MKYILCTRVRESARDERTVLLARFLCYPAFPLLVIWYTAPGYSMRKGRATAATLSYSYHNDKKIDPYAPLFICFRFLRLFFYSIINPNFNFILRSKTPTNVSKLGV